MNMKSRDIQKISSAIYVTKHVQISQILIVMLKKFTIMSPSPVLNAQGHSSERISYEIILLPNMVLSILTVISSP